MNPVTVGDFIKWSGCYYSSNIDGKRHRLIMDITNRTGIVTSISGNSIFVIDGDEIFEIYKDDKVRDDVGTSSLQHHPTSITILSRPNLKNESAL
jgi:hypothetical protein